MGLVISAGEINFIVVSYHPIHFDLASSLLSNSAGLCSGAPFYLVFDYEPITMIIPLNRRRGGNGAAMVQQQVKQTTNLLLCNRFVHEEEDAETTSPYYTHITHLPT